jgi:hypothetical protein
MKGDRNVYIEIGFTIIFPNSTDRDAEIEADDLLSEIKSFIKLRPIEKIVEASCSLSEENDEEDDIYDQQQEDEEEEDYQRCYAPLTEAEKANLGIES